MNFLQQQRDLSADIKKELEISLRRLRHEAHSLLDLSARLAPSKFVIESSRHMRNACHRPLAEALPPPKVQLKAASTKNWVPMLTSRCYLVWVK